MSPALKVLMIEDSENDAALIARELQKGGYAVEITRVETAGETKKALAEEQWDIVIADYSLPQFDGISALKILRDTGLDIPFILVSGTIGEAVAVEAMKAGAYDYIMKSNLSRLAPAITRELRELSCRRENRRIEKEKELMHAQLIHSDKMSALGQLAAGVAHELNNLISVVTGNVQYLLKVKNDEASAEILKDILTATQRFKLLITDLLTFSKKKDMLKQECNVHDLIDNMLHLCEYQPGFKSMGVEKNYSPDLPLINASSSHIEQVFLNVMSNAIHAMGDKGTLNIRTSITTDKEAVSISFTDTGEGISSGDLDKLFEPFFTTKSHGTGLGLAVSRSIIQKHGGTIKAESPGPGKGSTFIITLPLAGKDA